MKHIVIIITAVLMSISAFALSIGKTYFVNVSSKANVRTGPSVETDLAGYLFTNDQVKVLSLSEDLEWAEAQVVFAPRSQDLLGKSFYISTKLLDYKKRSKEIEWGSFSDRMAQSQYMIIQNVASEQLRVYKICRGDCPDGHKMVFETPMVVGDPNKNVTWLGNYYIREWTKFYEDRAGKYPSYYHPDYPPVPENPDRNWWLSDEALAGTRAGKLREKYGEYYGSRGAFGWYTALVGPGNHDAQWTHGTYGVASNKNYFIEFARGKNFLGSISSILFDLRSSGCSRVSNPQIAYLQNLVPAGTPIIKIYATEGARSRSSIKDRYKDMRSGFDWLYTLTTHTEEILQEGETKIDTYPTPIVRSFEQPGCQRSRAGDMYCVGLKYQLNRHERAFLKRGDGQFKGVFLVDEGRLVNYQHPKHKTITVGGLEKDIHPFLISTNKKFYQPIKWAPENNNIKIMPDYQK